MLESETPKQFEVLHYVAMADTMTNVFSTVSLTYVVDKIMKKKPEAGARLESK